MKKRLPCAVVLCLCSAHFLRAADAVDQITQRFIELTRQHCARCHSGPNREEKTGTDMDITDLTALADPRHNRVDLENPEKSRLYELLITTDEKNRMPKNKPALEPEEVQVVLNWIKSKQRDGQPDLGLQALRIFETYCYACHGQYGSSEGQFGYILDHNALIQDKVKPGDPRNSRVFIRMGIERTMPLKGSPQAKNPPSDADIAVIERWIAQGAPPFPQPTGTALPFASLKEELLAMRDRLRKAAREDRPYLRFFTLRHLHNLLSENLRSNNAKSYQIRPQDLRLYQAALSKLLNSLSWNKEMLLPEPVDANRTLFAIDVRRLDSPRLSRMGWKSGELWREILKSYPYGMEHKDLPKDRELNDAAEDAYRFAGSDVPVVRADWFIATASRPPLYHKLLQIPESASQLEDLLLVSVSANFQHDRLMRAAFNGSGVSGQNRLVERHDQGMGGYYWKSYDFRSSAGTGNLFVFPLGPLFEGNTFKPHAFEHAGGEIIFSLPNGLQGYMLVDGKDKRIDAGPVEIVDDSNRTSGTPLVVNGLSCMSCHRHGMIKGFKDVVRSSHILGGDAEKKILRLYPSPETLQTAINQDEQQFLQALELSMRPYLKDGADAEKNITAFPEPISAIAKWYLANELTLAEAASELNLSDPATLQRAIEHNPQLKRLGLMPLAQDARIKRETWETLEFFTSPFQEAARELNEGMPIRLK